jgi:thiol-disulfide isomerase/thioredoxin
MATIEITDENFEEKVLKSKTPVLLDFFATWCGPCSAISKPLEEISEEFKDKLIAQGADPIPGTPEQFARFITSEVERWRKLIAQSKITLE